MNCKSDKRDPDHCAERKRFPNEECFKQYRSLESPSGEDGGDSPDICGTRREVGTPVPSSNGSTIPSPADRRDDEEASCQSGFVTSNENVVVQRHGIGGMLCWAEPFERGVLLCHGRSGPHV
ncbi:hypothetical protein NDU88_003926 [Pleurodeles waltl]|uniref:Uncharacterized protein n=1 Tax=Pleurodeles waltl TaxID=8319 RepID=A0AAV7TPT3_PLEWA|nr:hypothetical protein NDU88_003926 [Pleurodeles waltl]